MALTRIRVLNQQSTYNVNRLNANTLVVGGNNITGASGAGGGIVISSVVYLAANGTPLIANAAPTSGNSVIKIIGSGFAANANVYLNGSLQPSANVTFVDSTELRLNMPALASNTYSLFTFNSAGAGAIFYSGVRFDPYPIWTTGTYAAIGNVSTQLLVTGYGSGSISFSVASGNTIPSGLTLSANGLITGTTTEGTYNFYVNATDSENEITTQQISLTVVFPDTYFPYTTLLLSASSQTANNVSTETFIDSSDYNNTLTVAAGTPHQGSFSPFPTNGTWSNYLSSSSTYFSTSEVALSALRTLGSYATIECWVNVPSFRTGIAAYNHPSILAIGNTWMNFGVNNGFPKFHWYDNGTYTLESSIAITLNTWNHIAVVFNGSGSNNLKIYVNGVLGATGTFTVISAGGSPLYIGREGDTPTDSYWIGYISNLRITNSALYTSNFTPSITALTAIANTTLLTCQSYRFIDNSTNAYAITVNGAVTTQKKPNPFGSNLIPYSNLTNSGSIYFAGDAYMTIPDSTALRLNGVECTIEMWYYPTQLTSYNVLIAKRGAGGDSYQVFTDVTTGNLAFYNGATAAYSSTPPKLNAWNHIAFVHDGSTTLTMYLNGVSVHTASIQIPLGTSVLNIGTDGSGSNNLTGYLSNLRILKGTRLYTSAFTPPAAPLTSITNTSLLLLGKNSKFLDSSMTTNIRNVGGVATRTDIKNYGTNSWYFNGSSYLTVLNNLSLVGNFTIESWIYLTAAQADFRMLVSTYSNYISIVSAGLEVQFGATAYTAATAPYSFSQNTWYHLAVVRNNNTVAIYVNGIPLSVTYPSQSTTFLNTSVYYIGTWNTTQHFWNGHIQDLRITNGIARYTTTFTPPTGPVPTS